MDIFAHMHSCSRTLQEGGKKERKQLEQSCFLSLVHFEHVTALFNALWSAALQIT